MIAELWRTFPKLLVQNINGLLDEAEPNALRSLQIYRQLKKEGLIDDDVRAFSRRLETFFAIPRPERRKSLFDGELRRPMSVDLYALFQLDFHSAAIGESSIQRLASWAHHLIRVSQKTVGHFMSLEVLSQTLRRLTSPSRFEKATHLTFEDFCTVWKRTVRAQLGESEAQPFAKLLSELDSLHRALTEESSRTSPPKVRTLQPELALAPGIYLTQSEIDWALAVREAARENAPVPEWPQTESPRTEILKDLLKVVTLYQISLTSNRAEIKTNREKIRATLLDRCEKVLAGKDERLAG